MAPLDCKVLCVDGEVDNQVVLSNIFLYLPLSLGKWFNLMSIFFKRVGKKHQLEMVV